MKAAGIKAEPVLYLKDFGRSQADVWSELKPEVVLATIIDAERCK